MPRVTVVMKRSRRAERPTPEALYIARARFGGFLLLQLNRIKKTPEWLGAHVGYSTPSSMRQVINGHQGVSREVYEKICDVIPIMRKIEEPPMVVRHQGHGAYGPHKKHEYPKGKRFEIKKS